MIRRLWKTVGIVAATMFCVASLSAQTVTAQQVKDIGIEIPGVESIRWLDNTKVAVTGLVRAPERPMAPYSGQRIGKLAIVDTVTSKADWFEEFFGRFCVDGGQFTLGSTDDIYHPETNLHEYHHWLLRGQPGKLKKREVAPEYLHTFDWLNCRPAGEQVPSWLEEAKKAGRQFIPLKAEHGWLEMSVGLTPHDFQGQHPIAIHPPGKLDQPVSIDTQVFKPWTDKKYRVLLMRFEAFKNAYLLALQDGGVGFDSGGLWWLHPDGRLEAIVQYRETGDWKSVKHYNLIPTAPDLLVIATQTPPEKTWGIYRRTTDNRLELLVSGWAQGGGYAVSPDGCKLAFGNDPRGYPNTRYRLQVINVCERNSK